MDCGNSKQSFSGVAEWLCETFALCVCNVDYRLAGSAPWPACGDDCLAAARFLLSPAAPIPGDPARRRLFVVGASSGGHLALMTGLRLPPGKVAGIVSISGIANMAADREFAPSRHRALFAHEPEPAELRAADPATYLAPSSPPVLCTHEKNDPVVPICASRRFLEAARRNGTVGKSYFYDRPEETGFSHRIWIPDSQPHKLYPDIEDAVLEFITNCMKTPAEVKL